MLGRVAKRKISWISKGSAMVIPDIIKLAKNLLCRYWPFEHLLKTFLRKPLFKSSRYESLKDIADKMGIKIKNKFDISLGINKAKDS